MRKILALSLVFGLGLCLTSASVRADDAEDKAALPAQVKKPGAIFRAPDSFTLDVALTADGKLLARAGSADPADETVDLWDVASGKKLHTLKGHTDPLLRVAFSPDGKTLASITGTWFPDDVRGEVKLWDVATGKERVSVKGHPGRGVALAFSPDGKPLASCGKTTVKLWDVETGKEKMELSVDALSLAFSPDGQTLATATKSVILWDVTTGKKRSTLPELKTILGISCVRFAPDGKTLASVSGAPGLDKDKPGALKLWDVATAKERATIPIRIATPLQFLDLAFTADGKTLISAMWSFGETQNEGGLAVQHWDLVTGKALAAFWAPFNFSGPRGAGTNAGMFFTALSADGKTVAWGGAEEQDKKITGTAHVWDVQSLATSPPKLSKKGEEPPAKKTPDEQDNDAEAKVVADKEQADSTAPAKEEAQALQVLDGGQETLTLKGHIDAVNSVAFSADGKRLASANSDQTVKVWDATSGQETLTLKGHTKHVTSVAFSADGKRLASASADGTVKVWDVTPRP